MKLLVYPHDLKIGGSQINAIDLAAAVSEAGHEVLVYGIPGPLVDYVHQRGLRFVAARRLRYRPAPSRIVQLAALAHRERVDLIHAYEWPPSLDAYFGASLWLHTPLVCTVLGMDVSPHVPCTVPLIMGTAALRDRAAQTHRGEVWTLEPPIDVVQDHPGIDGSGYRESMGVSDSELLVVSVSRFAIDLKLDALVRAIDAANALAARYPIKLVLVGGGEAHAALAARADAVNRRWSRPVVSCPGPTLDPRTAYAAADVVIGMGSSALRALAIGRPLIVQGEASFSEIFEPTTLPLFLRQGFYGLGDNAPNASRLAAQLEELLGDAPRRKALGEFGRSVVTERFSLRRAVDKVLRIYSHVLGHPSPYPARHALRCALSALRVEIDNHNPRLERARRMRESALLTAARAGLWPPAGSLGSPG